MDKRFAFILFFISLIALIYGISEKFPPLTLLGAACGVFSAYRIFAKVKK